MSDVTTVWTGTAGDWAMSGADLQSGSDLETAVLISLFSDARANPDDELPDAGQGAGSGDRRGWWGDDGEDAPIGSRLWLRDRAKVTASTAGEIRKDVAAALKWLVDDGVASAVDVTVQWDGRLMSGVIVIMRNTGPQTVRFSWAWGGVA